MAIDTISFNHVTVNQALGTTTLNGKLTINYDTLTVSGTITDGAGTNFSNFTIVTTDGGATYTLQGGGGLLATVSASYAGQTPTTTTVTYTSLGLLPGVTPNVPVTSAVAPCFATGTLIRTARGDVAIEDLAVGDLVTTASGEARPIRWIGQGTIDCRRHSPSHEVMPVRIGAHAFGNDRPSRDLLVSPGHSICIDLLGEILIPASSLVNGATIQQIEVDKITYWHVELESHDILLAENLPVESYLDMGNRGFFQDADFVRTAHPDAGSSQRSHADFCRPFYDAGPILEAAKAQLRKRAEARGWTRSDALDLHLIVDGRRLSPVVQDLTARFTLPATAKDVWIVSPAERPCNVMTCGDSRSLGVCIGSLRIDDGLSHAREISVDDPLLGEGFYEPEEGVRRWTNGRARLPAELWSGCKDVFFLRTELASPPVPRWTVPAVPAYPPQLAIVA